MMNWLNAFFISENEDDPSFVNMFRNILIAVFIILILLTLVQSGIFTGKPQLRILGVIAIAATLNGFFIYLAFKGVLWPGKIFLPSALLLAVTFSMAAARGLRDISVMGLPAVMLVASLLLGRKSLVFWTIASAFSIVIVGYLDIIGYTPDSIARTTGVDTIVVALIILFATSLILRLVLERFEKIIKTAKQNEVEQIQANTELRKLQTSLEQRVEERTGELEEANQQNEHRAQQFEAVTLVGNAISSIRSLDQLLPRITELISQQFGYYHAGIFLSDANNENAVLSAANSEGGKRMLSRGHQLKIGEQGLVGYATSTGKPRIALDVGEDAVYFDNPDMPDTRSEMALPLKIGEDIVGALDVQSTEESAFSEEDISVLSLLADQVSLAIENARLFDQARKSLAESEALYRQYLRQAWTRLPKEQNLTGFRYNVRGSSPIEAKPETGSMITSSQEKESETHSSSLSVPIAIRGETIGTLSVQVPGIKSINDDQKDLVNAVAERVALSAENARLFEETTRRAERERLVSDITVKIRSTNDPEAMVKTALDELKNALGATKVQLIPHTLEKEETTQELENSTLPSAAKPKRKRNKK